MDNPDTEDIQDNSYYSQSSTNVNVGLLVVAHFQQLETSSRQLLSELDDEMQAEITETKIVFPTDFGLVWEWAWAVYDPSQKWKHY